MLTVRMLADVHIFDEIRGKLSGNGTERDRVGRAMKKTAEIYF